MLNIMEVHETNQMIEQEKHLAPEEVRYSKRDSYIFTGKVRDIK